MSRKVVNLASLIALLLLPFGLGFQNLAFATAANYKTRLSMAPDSLGKVVLVGSGNFGSAMATVIAPNVLPKDLNMWVFEENLSNGEKLTDYINKYHENPRYLPGITLPSNVVAVPDVAECCRDADVVVFVLPHQFLSGILPKLKDVISPRARIVSLIKGVDFADGGVKLISDTISEGLGGRPCSVMMGANVASEIARNEFAEGTIGCRDKTDGEVLKRVFQTEKFRVTVVEDGPGVEVCGALKNIVALGAGFSDGLGFGGNTKSALIRLGLLEMIRFTRLFFPATTKSTTFWESCGVSDLITTCYGGRNRKCAEAFVKAWDAEKGGGDWDAIEEKLLNGQKLQGTLTAKDVHAVLVARKAVDDFPLFTTVYKIAFEGLHPKNIVDVRHILNEQDGKEHNNIIGRSRL